MLFGVTSKGAANEIPRGISVPAFCVHTYFAPGGVYISGVSFAVERLRSHPARDGARGSAPFVSFHTLLELGAQYTFVLPRGVSTLYEFSSK